MTISTSAVTLPLPSYGVNVTCICVTTLQTSSTEICSLHKSFCNRVIKRVRNRRYVSFTPIITNSLTEMICWYRNSLAIYFLSLRSPDISIVFWSVISRELFLTMYSNPPLLEFMPFSRFLIITLICLFLIELRDLRFMNIIVAFVYIIYMLVVFSHHLVDTSCPVTNSPNGYHQLSSQFFGIGMIYNNPV